MTERASAEETTTNMSLPTSPAPQKDNDDGDIKPMEVDLAVEESSPASADNGAAKNNGGADLGTPGPSTPSLLNTPKQSALKTADCFKTPEPRTPTSSAKKRKRLTPEEKSLREKERQEKRRKLEEEKQKKEEERVEKARQKEAERLKKEEEKRRLEEEKKREREKKEEERKKLEEEKRQERQKKEEERLKKEEERLKKEEERKQKEDEKRRQAEEKEKELRKVEEKKEKQKQLFTNFFQKSSAPKVKIVDDSIVYLGTGTTLTLTTSKSDGERVSESPSTVTEESSKSSCLFYPLPFQIKTDMAVAPLCRREKLRTEEVSKLDSIIGEADTSRVESNSIKGGSGDPGKQNPSGTGFLKRLKEGNGRRDQKTEVTTSKDSEAEIQILNDDAEKPKNVAGYVKWRMKLLQFHDNRRPPYWGTWKRKGKKIMARRPLAQEEDLDYDFDSDDEWEDEPEDAEEIVNSDNEKDEQENAEGEDDEEDWLVPHGYLSDTERDGTDGDIESMKNKEKEFYTSLKQKTLIGLPFIETHDLAGFTIRICPVFKYV